MIVQGWGHDAAEGAAPLTSWSEQRAHDRAVKRHRKHYGAQHMQAIREGKVKQDPLLQTVAPFLIWVAIVGAFLFIMGAFVAGAR